MTFILRCRLNGLTTLTTHHSEDALDEALDRTAEDIARRWGVTPDVLQDRTWFRGKEACSGRTFYGPDYAEWSAA